MIIGALLGLSLAAQPQQQVTEVCAYKPGSKKLALVQARTLNQAPTGVVIVNGRDIAWDKSGFVDAAGKSWSIKNEPIQFGGKTYVKYGLPRVLSLNEVEWIGEKDGAAISAERGLADREVIYVLHRGLECAFQPYEMKR
ncbi:MAG: hypothetical protein EOP60_01025 [Sphingomonadales bacterium]|nr:MAG: hypothetical protein EOP60_01025 [Sphingomonadales bacterium]